MTELVDYAERMTRAAIRELPDGVYDFLDHIDDDGIDVGRPIPLKVTITKAGDTITVDWTGTSPQVKGAINNTLSYTKSASYCGIRSILPQNIPTNEGVFRAINVDRAGRHDRQHGVAGRLRRARPHRLPHGRLHVRRARQDAAGPRCSPPRTAAIPACRSAAITATAARSSTSISPAAPGARGPMPTGSTAIRTSTPTWPRSRSR